MLLLLLAWGVRMITHHVRYMTPLRDAICFFFSNGILDPTIVSLTNRSLINLYIWRNRVFAMKIIKMIRYAVLCYSWKISISTYQLHRSLYSTVYTSTSRRRNNISKRRERKSVGNCRSISSPGNCQHTITMFCSIDFFYQCEKQIILGSPTSEHFFITFNSQSVHRTNFHVEHTCRSLAPITTTTVANAVAAINIKKKMCWNIPKTWSKIYGKSKWNQKLNGASAQGKR